MTDAQKNKKQRNAKAHKPAHGSLRCALISARFCLPCVSFSLTNLIRQLQSVQSETLASYPSDRQALYKAVPFWCVDATHANARQCLHNLQHRIRNNLRFMSGAGGRNSMSQIKTRRFVIHCQTSQRFCRKHQHVFRWASAHNRFTA